MEATKTTVETRNKEILHSDLEKNEVVWLFNFHIIYPTLALNCVYQLTILMRSRSIKDLTHQATILEIRPMILVRNLTYVAILTSVEYDLLLIGNRTHHLKVPKPFIYRVTKKLVRWTSSRWDI